MSRGIYAGSDDWLVKAARLDAGGWLTVHPRPPHLDWKSGQDALDAQYGKGIYRAWTHGNAFHVELRPNPNGDQHG